MTRVGDLMDLDLLEQMISGGYVRVQSHPNYPYRIANYAEKAVYEKVWNEVTLQCRGLIYHAQTHEILARPFPKFFNYGERVDDAIPLGSVKTFDKADGSLGIMYDTPDGYAIATRGSFTSEQAVKATQILREKYWEFEVCCGYGYTWLFEIIYPENRIVLDYGDMEDLVLLDVINNETGVSDWNTESVPLGCGEWEGPTIEIFPHTNIAEALVAPPRPNAEGFVVLFEDGTRLKIKQENYKRLHAVMTNTSTTTVWETLRNGLEISDLFAEVPDEFRDWVNSVVNDLDHEFYIQNALATDHYYTLVDRLDALYGDNCWERKDFAKDAQSDEYRAELFLLLDGKDISELIWKRIKPERALPFRNEVEK